MEGSADADGLLAWAGKGKNDGKERTVRNLGVPEGARQSAEGANVREPVLSRDERSKLNCERSTRPRTRG